MTFAVTIDDSNKLLLKDYMEHVNESLSKVARKSTVEMIVDIYHLSVKSMAAMEEYRKNPVTYKFSDFMAEFESA